MGWYTGEREKLPDESFARVEVMTLHAAEGLNVCVRVLVDRLFMFKNDLNRS